jgi:hypothetical protein
MASDSTALNAVDAETTPIGSVKQGISLPNNDIESPSGTGVFGSRL